ncbi:MAG: EF-hand domain-containing protein [Nitrosomonadales bacterium]|nr:EF-hand domain-containing protein [Nitrosomonadales bacterium]
MKKTTAYFAALSCLVISTGLAHAEGDACDKNMPAQHHGKMDPMTFSKLDTNGDGVISKKEFNAYNAKHFKELDINKDGKLTLEELQGGHTQGMGHGDATTHLDQRFNAADTNHDGGLDRDEAKNMPMLAMYFDEVDANKDGKVTRQEYFDAMPLLHGAKKIAPKQKMESM